jgi:hypothetical protein
LTASVVLSDMNSKRLALLAGIFALMAWAVGFAQASGPSGADPKTIPVIDGGLGPCSADFTVTDAAGAPVYDAKIRVHIAYGFMNARKLDLEVGTNADGKARFEGLPNRLKRGLYFHATNNDSSGEAFDDPASTCEVQLSIVLRKKVQ